MNFSQIILEPEQKQLFIQIVEAAKKVPRVERIIINTKLASNENWLTVGSIKESRDIDGVADGDLEELKRKRFLTLTYTKGDTDNYAVTPEGLQYYDWLMKPQGKPVERIQENIFRYFEFEDFKKEYAAAYKKLKQAEELLWSSDSDANFSAIGHHCREAMQEFADQLYNKVTGETSNEPKSHDKNRIKAVIETKKTEIGTTVPPFLDALYNYWDSISDLVQRQEHGAQKEGEPINWEDARRVVFQTANVIFELHRTIGK